MKSIMISFICVLCLLFTVQAHSDITSYSVRKGELQDALGVAMSQTMREYMVQGSYGIVDEKTFTAAFLRSLLSKVNSDGEITVKIVTLDMEEGFLDVEVIQKYQDYIGKERELKLRRTVILEEPTL